MKKQVSVYILFSLVFICLILMNIVLFNLISRVEDLNDRIVQQENSLQEVQTNMEGYIDNYVAMWTTLNNAIAGEPEDK